jgi:hypothetical protein
MRVVCEKGVATPSFVLRRRVGQRDRVTWFRFRVSGIVLIALVGHWIQEVRIFREEIEV